MGWISGRANLQMGYAQSGCSLVFWWRSSGVEAEELLGLAFFWQGYLRHLDFSWAVHGAWVFAAAFILLVLLISAGGVHGEHNCMAVRVKVYGLISKSTVRVSIWA